MCYFMFVQRRVGVLQISIIINVGVVFDISRSTGSLHCLFALIQPYWLTERKAPTYCIVCALKACSTSRSGWVCFFAHHFYSKNELADHTQHPSNESFTISPCGRMLSLDLPAGKCGLNQRWSPPTWCPSCPSAVR